MWISMKWLDPFSQWPDGYFVLFHTWLRAIIQHKVYNGGGGGGGHKNQWEQNRRDPTFKRSYLLTSWSPVVMKNEVTWSFFLRKRMSLLRYRIDPEVQQSLHWWHDAVFCHQFLLKFWSIAELILSYQIFAADIKKQLPKLLHIFLFSQFPAKLLQFLKTRFHEKIIWGLPWFVWAKKRRKVS